MDTKDGYELADWDAAKDEMRNVLIERAQVRGMIREYAHGTIADL